MERLFWTLLFCAFVTVSFATICPDGSYCMSDNTCCEMAENEYGCCPLPNAVCCDDKIHCCPNGSTCSEGACVKDDHAIKKGTTVCPGGDYFCPGDDTCCSYGVEYTCCPLSGATCCSDGLHCCPGGTNCDLANGTCTKIVAKITNVAASQPAALRYLIKLASAKRPQAESVVCPDGSACPDQMTCCPMAGGQYGCCPSPQATCCSDLEHCCPNGYQCQGTQCVRSGANGLQVVPWLTKVPAHRPKAESVVCPDGSACPDQMTCCPMAGGQYGCCPSPQATCCSDLEHCCPNGYQCQGTQCVRSGANGLLHKLPWLTKVPAHRPKVESVVCPDGSACPDQMTCCPMAGGQYGCCPSPQATCCSDLEHCCPNGYQCQGTQCVRSDSKLGVPKILPWLTKFPSLPKRH